MTDVVDARRSESGADAGRQAVPLSVIIVNYNGARFIGECLDSLLSAVPASVQVVVVDNRSTDESLQTLRGYGSRITLVASPTNGGFAAGVNLGVSHARGEWLLLLNPDTRVSGDLMNLFQHARSLPGLGVLGPSVRYPDGRQQFSVGYEHAPWRIVLAWLGGDRLGRFTGCCGLQERRPGKYQHCREVDWVSGCCMVTSRAVWDRVGGLDERFFMYVEDVDYCRRVRRLGMRVVYDPTFEIAHKEGGSVAGFNRAALARSCTSYVRYTEKWSGRFAARVLRLTLGGVLIVRGFGAFVLEKGLAMGRLADRRRAWVETGFDLVVGELS